MFATAVPHKNQLGPLQLQARGLEGGVGHSLEKSPASSVHLCPAIRVVSVSPACARSVLPKWKVSAIGKTCGATSTIAVWCVWGGGKFFSCFCDLSGN